MISSSGGGTVVVDVVVGAAVELVTDVDALLGEVEESWVVVEGSVVVLFVIWPCPQAAATNAKPKYRRNPRLVSFEGSTEWDVSEWRECSIPSEFLASRFYRSRFGGRQGW